MSKALSTAIALFVVGVLLGLLQLWFSPWSGEVFVKIELTLAAMLLVLLVVWFAAKESAETRKNERGDDVDRLDR